METKKITSIPRQLMVLFFMAGGVTIAMAVLYYFTATKICKDSTAETETVAAKLGQGYNLLQTISNDQAEHNRFIQQFFRQTDPDAIEKSIHDRDAHQKDVIAQIEAAGPAAEGIKKQFTILVSLENGIIQELLKGNGAVAGEKNMQQVVPQGEVVLGEIRLYHAQVEAEAKNQLAAQQASVRSQIILRLIILIGLLACVMFAGRRLKNQIANTLQRIAGELSKFSAGSLNSAALVSSSSQTLAEGSSEQAASIEETGSSLEEMSSVISRNSENAQKANDLARQTRSAAEKGASDMNAMSAAMHDIKNSSDDIAKIIRTIDEIAFQTNILALNAAVEAARAGEAGMGFAVVADEVRNLAQRSAQAARETATKIEGAIGNTARGVDISSKVSQALNEIVEKARQVDELAAEVASASQEQAHGITQINSAVGQMDKVTQGNAASAEESAAAAQELNQQARAMQETVAELLQLVGNDTDVPLVKKNSNRNKAASFAPPSRAATNSARPEKSTARDTIPLESGFRDF
jgi:methyl-accepting chemotaxis protein